ncbi:hypothetical protein [Halorussus pelagicus]|uniref:hypothetical protein n=1 Tax=Halorussus pelagicus TaxID=2505977 RepID=UPI000FFB663C|nr:hypothetical protein [Halorussus pelagicus]
MSTSKTTPQETDADTDEWTTVGVRPLFYANGSYRVTVTKAKDEVALVEGEKYVIKTREDGAILLDPQ